jgi:hypothetical protein
MTRALVALALAASAAGGLARTTNAAGQRRFLRGEPVRPNPDYDGRFTFVRIRYGPPSSVVHQGLPWSHDYPLGEQHFMKIMNDVTLLRPRTDETAILAFDDVDLFRYPIVYMAEPGYWTVSEEEAAAFRAYLLKGGFIIFDDFSEQRGGWAAFEQTFRRVLPEAQFFDLQPTHQIFHSFFEIPSFDILPQAYDYGRPVFRGVFEENDPRRRLLAMVNYNTDISEYWEEAGTGWRPDWETNEAYKFGVNYVMYGMTH